MLLLSKNISQHVPGMIPQGRRHAHHRSPAKHLIGLFTAKDRTRSPRYSKMVSMHLLLYFLLSSQMPRYSARRSL